MNDSRKIKTLVFGMMDGSNKRGRPHREWSDDIEQWCGATLQELSQAALDRQRWAALDTKKDIISPRLSIMMMMNTSQLGLPYTPEKCCAVLRHFLQVCRLREAFFCSAENAQHVY